MSETVEAPPEETRERLKRSDGQGQIGFYSWLFRKLMAACDTPWIILPAYVGIRTFSAMVNGLLQGEHELWFSIPDLYLSSLLVLWAAARYKAAAIAPSICLMVLKIVSLDTGLIVIADSNLLHIPILVLALKAGLDPPGMAQTSASTRGTWVDMVGLILIASVWARYQIGDLSVEANGSGAVLMVLFFFVRPRPLWLFLLLAALFWLAAAQLFLPFGVDDIFGNWQGNMMPFLLDVLLSPLVAMVLLWAFARLSGAVFSSEQFFFLKPKTARPLFFFWLIVFAWSVLPVPYSELTNFPFFTMDFLTSSRLVSMAVLGLLIIRVGFRAAEEAQNFAAGALVRHLQALLLPAAFAGLFSTNFWLLKTPDLQQAPILEDKSAVEAIRDVIDVTWFLELSAADIPFVLLLFLGPVVQVFLLFALAFWAGKALVRQDSPLDEEWFPDPDDDTTEAGRLTLIFGEKGRLTLIALGLVFTMLAVVASFFPL